MISGAMYSGVPQYDLVCTPASAFPPLASHARARSQQHLLPVVNPLRQAEVRQANVSFVI
jgi:hypothetical protein